MTYNPGEAVTKIDDTNVTLTLGGTPTKGAVRAYSLTLGWTGSLGVVRGGTGFATATQGDIIYSDASNSFAKLAKDTNATRYLSNTGSSNNPAWAQVNLANGVTGDLPFANIAQITTARVLGRTTAGTGDIEELTITGTGSVVFSASPTLTGTINCAAITATGTVQTGAVVSTTGNISGTAFIRTSGATGGIGYTTGAGSTVTQANTSGKATTVTLNRATGEITMDGATLNAATSVTFTFNNSAVAAVDMLVFVHHATGTFGAYKIDARCTGAGTASVTVTNVSAGNLGEAIVLKFAVIKCVTS